MTKIKCQREFEKYCKKYSLCIKKENGRYINNQHIYDSWQAAWKAALESKKVKDDGLLYKKREK